MTLCDTGGGGGGQNLTKTAWHTKWTAPKGCSLKTMLSDSVVRGTNLMQVYLWNSAIPDKIIARSAAPFNWNMLLSWWIINFKIHTVACYCHKSNKVWPGKQDASQVRWLRVKRAARNICYSTNAICRSTAVTPSDALVWLPEQTATRSRLSAVVKDGRVLQRYVRPTLAATVKRETPLFTSCQILILYGYPI